MFGQAKLVYNNYSRYLLYNYWLKFVCITICITKWIYLLFVIQQMSICTAVYDTKRINSLFLLLQMPISLTMKQKLQLFQTIFTFNTFQILETNFISLKNSTIKCHVLCSFVILRKFENYVLYLYFAVCVSLKLAIYILLLGIFRICYVSPKT